MRRETSRRRLRRPVTVTPAEGQLPSPARSCCPGSRPALASILAADSSRRPAPPRPALPPRLAAPARPSGPRPRPPWGRRGHPTPQALGLSRLTDLLSRRCRRRRCRHLDPLQPALALWHWGGTHTPDGHAPPRPCHAPERNPEWVKESWVGSDPRRRVPRDSERPGLDGCGRDGMHSGASSNSLERTPSKSKTCLSLPHTFHCGMLYHVVTA